MMPTLTDAAVGMEHRVIFATEKESMRKRFMFRIGSMSVTNILFHHQININHDTKHNRDGVHKPVGSHPQTTPKSAERPNGRHALFLSLRRTARLQRYGAEEQAVGRICMDADAARFGALSPTALHRLPTCGRRRTHTCARRRRKRNRRRKRSRSKKRK